LSCKRALNQRAFPNYNGCSSSPLLEGQPLNHTPSGLQPIGYSVENAHHSLKTPLAFHRAQPQQINRCVWLEVVLLRQIDVWH